jgi:hypothetical protein
LEELDNYDEDDEDHIIDEDDDDDDDDDDEDDDEEDEDDDLDDDDIWTIKPKLLSYYETQFKTMQKNLNGYITGAVAKPFFEKSKLPLSELSKIWELSDVTKDGVLSFAEFCTAMHLVVLRVRNFDLPNELPAKLQPYAPLIDFNSETNLLNTKSARALYNEELLLNQSDSEDLTISSPTQSASKFPSLSSSQQTDRPLHFSVKPQMQPDVQLAHPVALRYQQQQQQYQYPQHQQQQLAYNNNHPSLVPEPPPRHSRSSSLGAINASELVDPSDSSNTTTTTITTTNSSTTSNNIANTNTPKVPLVNSTLSNNSLTRSAINQHIVNTPVTPKILQQQPPAVPPRITSPLPNYNQSLSSSQQQQLPPPPPPPPPPSQVSSLSSLLSQQYQQQQFQNRAVQQIQTTPQLYHQTQQQQQPQQQQQQKNVYSTSAQQFQTNSSSIGGSMTAFRAAPLPPSSSNHPQMSAGGNNDQHAFVEETDPVKLIEKMVEQMNILNTERLKKNK